MASPTLDRIATSTHVFETRQDALEVKFLVDPAKAAAIRAWAREHLTADPHGTGVFGDEYRTTSVYLDTDRLDVFNRRGSYGRSKYRVRRYGSDAVVYLERKLRSERRLIKRRSAVPIHGLEHLQTPDATGAWDGGWFARRLAVRRLHPVCQVSYARMARHVPGTDGQARFTLDEDIRARPSGAYAFESGPDLPVLDGRLILEMKFRRYMPALFKQFVEQFVLEPSPCSKYRLAAAALNLEWEHAPAIDATHPPHVDA